jgi:hypothetical protein
MDLELETYFERILKAGDDEFLAVRAAHLDSCFGDEPFSLPDASGYSGDAAAEVETAILLEQVMGLDSQGAQDVVNEIVKCRQTAVAKVSKRRVALRNIIDRTRRLPVFRAIQDHPHWENLLVSAENMVSFAVAEAAEGKL